jgi:ribosomal protein S18 acetylase RimI-like enzyme
MKSQAEEVRLREAVEADVNGILETQRAAFERYAPFVQVDAFPPLCESAEGVLEDIRKKTVLVAEDMGGFIAGSIRYSLNAGVCIFDRLSVHPSHQGRGIGKLLVHEVERSVAAKVHKIMLETGLLAEQLLIFYTRLGYSGEAVLRNHYGSEDWIVMSKFP